MVNLIALGNRLRGDDGIGPIVLQNLAQRKEARHFNLIEAGSDAFAVLEYLNGKQPNIVVDCAEMGAPPGTVKKMRLAENDLGVLNDLISLHGFSFAEIYAMARSLGEIAPTTLVGIQPATIDFGEKLSPQVEQAIPQILELIIQEAKYYA